MHKLMNIVFFLKTIDRPIGRIEGTHFHEFKADSNSLDEWYDSTV